MWRRSRAGLAAALAAAALVAGCAATRHRDPRDLGVVADLAAAPDLCGTPSPGIVHTVRVASAGSMSFSPATVHVRAGDAVRWIFDASGHTVTSLDGTFCFPDDRDCARGVLGQAGDTYTHTFPSKGTFHYFCIPHLIEGMEGDVVVE
jgi:plastocyanin